MTDRIREVVADVFGVSAATLTEESGPDTVDGWDSLGHVNLVLSLESEFAVPLSPEDAIQMLSIAEIRRVLAEKGVG